ncbi:MAG: hypothetical protein HOE11_03835 [Candidatus Diapherotrites archaeon]|nr:hypothetical protein [Candidatus Diapherotrites archaeon]MBT4597229.1 hypothetical protein [Candidatus Diapherotrites archaeon]
MSRFQIGILLIGVGIGSALPGLPAPLSMLNSWLWIILVVIGIGLIIKGS